MMELTCLVSCEQARSKKDNTSAFSAWGSIDFLYIGDCTISVNDIRTAQHYDIPCSVVDKRYWEREEKDLKMNLWSYWHLH